MRIAKLIAYENSNRKTWW